MKNNQFSGINLPKETISNALKKAIGTKDTGKDNQLTNTIANKTTQNSIYTGVGNGNLGTGDTRNQEAVLASKLPKDFPIENWEKLSTKAQLNAMKFSGLSDQEQWQLLNASAPLKTLRDESILDAQPIYKNKQENVASNMNLKSERDEQRKEQSDIRKQLAAQARELSNSIIKTNPASLRAIVDAKDKMYTELENINVDVLHLTDEQRDIVQEEFLQIMNHYSEGTLTGYVKNSIINDTCFRIAQETTPPDRNTTYITVLRKKDVFTIPSLGDKESSELSTQQINELKQYDNNDYKQFITSQANKDYEEAVKNGIVNPGEYQEFYDKAVKTVYEKGAKLIPIIEKSKHQKVMKLVPIGDLISPYAAEDFGVQLAKEAMKLVKKDGTKRNEIAGQGTMPNMKIDCSRLVTWAVFQINPFWGEYGVGKDPFYQMLAFSNIIWQGDPETDDLNMKTWKTGDTLFWENDDTGKIVHTAIYIGNDYMLEAGETISIVKVREFTHDNDLGNSRLVQVNRMTTQELEKNAQKNQYKH